MNFLDRGAGDVVGDEDDPGVDAVALQPLLSQGEVHDVAGVVAGGEQQSGAVGGGPADRVGLMGGRRGEDVADHGAVGEAGSDDAAERRIVPGSAADDDRDLARRLAGPDTPPSTPSTRSP